MHVLAAALSFLGAGMLLVFPAGVLERLANPLEQKAEYVRTFVPLPPARAEILFGGDMMFDRSIRQVGEAEGQDFLLSCIKDTLLDADVVVANLEGPITPYPSMSVGSVIGSAENVTFTFPTTTASLLARHNIGIVNLGNNHIMNFGRDGLLETKRWLESAGVLHMGDPDSSEAERVLRTHIRGIPFAFVNWSDWTSDKTDHTVAQVRLEKEAGQVVVVYTHWGDEYVPPSERVRTLARQFVDAGADIVIGSHPHVVLEREDYNGGIIYYSLGNFVFDQYWEDAVRNGLLLKVEFSKNGVEGVEEIPIELSRDRRVCLKSVE